MTSPVSVPRPPPLSDGGWADVQQLHRWADHVVNFSQRLSNPVSVTAAYTVASNVYEVRANGTFTVTLPPVGTTGRPVLVKNIGSGTITVDGSGSETIDGAATQTLSAQYQSIAMIDNGSSWDIVFKHGTYLLVSDIDDTPVNGETSAPISSNWAFDHVAAADPHTGYRLESADHTHQSTGAQAGQLDHGLALTGLTDDDHTQYLLASAATDRATFATNWTDLTDGGETSLHSHAGSGGVTTILAPTSLGTGATYDITSIAATYAYLILRISGASHDNASNRQLQIFVDTDNGASFDTTTTNYIDLTSGSSTSDGLAPAHSNRGAAITWEVYVLLFGYQGVTFPWFVSYLNESTPATADVASGIYIGSSSAAINAIRVQWNGAGNFDAGTAALYGVS